MSETANVHELRLVVTAADFDEALSRDAKSVPSYQGRAAARLQLGRPREAVEDAEKAVALAPEDARVTYAAAGVLAQAGEQLLNVLRLMTRRSEVERGQSYLDKLLLENPRHPELPAFMAVLRPNGGVSGVAVLAESHISIHTWPEASYAAIDIFMCGNAKPDACIPVLREAFQPKNIAVGEHLRGQGA